MQTYGISKKAKTKLAQINIWDIISILFIITIFTLLAKAAIGMDAPYKLGEQLPISLDISALPYYSMRTVVRMAIALIVSLIFSLIVGYISAKYKRAEMIFIPTIDILQSVPMLAFQSMSILYLIHLFPNSLLGPECAAIFVIFTSQAWNMTLSIYQSIKLLPEDYQNIGSSLNLNAWQKFWRIELPYATPSLLWNMMVSLSSGWFFIVATEAIEANKQDILLPGIGSYIFMATESSNITAIGYAVFAMLIIIFIYDQLIFRPLLKLSTQFQEQEKPDVNPEYNQQQEYKSWVYDFIHKTSLLKELITIKDYIADFWINKLAYSYKYIKKRFISNNLNKYYYKSEKLIKNTIYNKIFNKINYSFLYKLDWFSIIVSIFLIYILYSLTEFIAANINYTEILYVIYLGAITALKIFILVILCSLFWLPVGTYIATKPSLSKYIQPVIQFIAAFPLNTVYPIIGFLILEYNLNVELTTMPLLIIGTQWYILFNIIAAASTIPLELKDAVKNLRVTSFLYWKRFLFPAVFPSYITGAMAAAGGAWNASIVAEAIPYGGHVVYATGLGAYITEATKSGDMAKVALSITIMSLYVIIFNKLLWQKLYNLAASRYQITN